MTPLTIADVHALPATVSLMTAARALGCGRTLAYELARNDAFPCPVERLGRLYRVRTADLLRALKIDPVSPPDPVGGSGHPPAARP